MKTVLVTGANGQLGNSIYARISSIPAIIFFFTDIDTLDICDKEAVRKYVLENDVQYVMNCAAYTAVDKAEDNVELCDRLNHLAPGYWLRPYNPGESLIQVSTDYVFDGSAHVPYGEGQPLVRIRCMVRQSWPENRKL